MDNQTRDKLLKVVQNNYQTIAQDFNVTRHKEIWLEIRRVAAGVKSGDRILDLGCGNGRLLEALKEKQIEYLGIDNSPELIKLAQENYPNRFLVHDIVELKQLVDNNFDYIFCLAVLQHIPSTALKVEVLREIKKKLKPNGQIIISNWNLWQGKHRKLVYKAYFKKIIGRSSLGWGDILFFWKNSAGEEISQRYYHAFTKKELMQLAKKAGLETMKIYKDKHNYWLILE